MNITIFIIEAIIVMVVFTAMILIPLTKNPVYWIHDFPEDIQDEYFKTHDLFPTSFFSTTVLIKKSLGLLIALGLLIWMIWLVEAKTFTQAFIASYGLWMIVNWYDCFILDWVLFANIKSVRLPGTEHMDKAYHQKTYISSVRYGVCSSVLSRVCFAPCYTLYSFFKLSLKFAKK